MFEAARRPALPPRKRPGVAAVAMIMAIACASVVAAEDEPPAADVKAIDPPSPALTPYEPMYAVIGWRESTTVKFQFSFKFRPINPASSLGSKHPWVTRFKFAFTQTSLWDVESDSSPFRDSSYKPSLIYLQEGIWESRPGGTRLTLQAGIEHESNGKDEEDSRSLNIVYVRPIFTFGDVERYHWTVAPKIYAYLGDLEDNPDIAEYRGYVDLLVTWGNPERWRLDLLLRHGTEGHQGSVQFDASYPLKKVGSKTFEFFGHFQYFNGYGETLLDYNVKGPAQFRLGFMILR